MSAWRRAPRLEWRRIRALVGSVAAMLGCLLLLDVLLSLVAGRHPQPLQRAELLDPAELERIGRRLADAERARAREGPAPKPLVVITGLSTAREDIDAGLLGTLLCGGSDVLNLASSGGSFRELAFYSTPMRLTRLTSVLTVVAVHPVWLAGRQSGRNGAEDDGGPVYRGPRFSIGKVKWMLARGSWVVANRAGIHALVLDMLWSVRREVAALQGWSASHMFAAGVESPWSSRFAYRGRRASEDFLSAQLTAWRAYGWFDPRSFREPGDEVAAVRETLADAQSLVGPVVLVELPEPTLTRQLIPADAQRLFDESVGSTRRLNFRSAVTDSLFYDHAHLNAAGRALLTARLGTALRPLANCSDVAGAARNAPRR